jgi:hypothetical protein
MEDEVTEPMQTWHWTTTPNPFASVMFTRQMRREAPSTWLLEKSGDILNTLVQALLSQF